MSCVCSVIMRASCMVSLNSLNTTTWRCSNIITGLSHSLLHRTINPRPYTALKTQYFSVNNVWHLFHWRSERSQILGLLEFHSCAKKHKNKKLQPSQCKILFQIIFGSRSDKTVWLQLLTVLAHRINSLRTFSICERDFKKIFFIGFRQRKHFLKIFGD